METISSIEESDTSAIDRIEAERAAQRQATNDATNLATTRSAMLKSGAGVGAAALGIGLGALLTLYGVSLLTNRPTLEEVTIAMRDQVATIERIANGKVEEIKTEAAARVAAAEKAAEVKSAAAKVAEDKAASAVRGLAEKFAASPSSKTVVDFTVFRRQKAGDLRVNTGWRYEKMSDPAPSFQYCHMYKSSGGDTLQLAIAQNGRPLLFDPERAAKVGVTWSEVQQALPYCDWFQGANPNIREKLAELP